eukprot:TRINITY_DN50427_c0_g1_i1.p1 TRINITY_DN50427_c0_g1~~TRINITY_DN50427_c0_g1_i1.p1  ORF type:complete len:595 (+),score=88.15 TRINITY_DN50427_c0_g1_i1:78-1862(+)
MRSGAVSVPPGRELALPPAPNALVRPMSAGWLPVRRAQGRPTLAELLEHKAPEAVARQFPGKGASCTGGAHSDCLLRVALRRRAALQDGDASSRRARHGALLHRLHRLHRKRPAGRSPRPRRDSACSSPGSPAVLPGGLIWRNGHIARNYENPAILLRRLRVEAARALHRQCAAAAPASAVAAAGGDGVGTAPPSRPGLGARRESVGALEISIQCASPRAAGRPPATKAAPALPPTTPLTAATVANDDSDERSSGARSRRSSQLGSCYSPNYQSQAVSPADGQAGGQGVAAAGRKPGQRRVKAVPFCTERTYRDLVRSFEDIDKDGSGTLQWSELAEWVRNGRMGRKAALRFAQQESGGASGVFGWTDILRFFYPQATEAQIEVTVARWGWPLGAEPAKARVEQHWACQVTAGMLAEALELWAALSDVREGREVMMSPRATEADLQTAEARQEAATAASAHWRGVTLARYTELIGAEKAASSPVQVKRRKAAHPRAPTGALWPPSPRTLSAQFAELDTDGDGYLSLRELLPLVSFSRAPLRDMLAAAGDPVAASAVLPTQTMQATVQQNIWLDSQRKWLYDDKHLHPHMVPALQ